MGSVPLGAPWGGLSRVSAPGITLRWAQEGLCLLDHLRVGLAGSFPLGSLWGWLSGVSAPWITLGWAEWGFCPSSWLSEVSAPWITLGWAQQDFCPWGGLSGVSVPQVGSAESPPLRLYPAQPQHPLPCTQAVAASSITHILQQPPPQGRSSGSCFSLSGSRGFTLCAAFFCNPLKGSSVTSQGKPPAPQEPKPLSGLHGFSKEKRSGMRGGKQC